MNRSPTMTGFTLLEVLIAMAIMSFLAFYTTQAIQRAILSRAKIQKDIDKNSTLRDALRIITRDIEVAFNHRDVGIEVYNRAWRERIRLAEEQERATGGATTAGNTTAGATTAGATTAGATTAGATTAGNPTAGTTTAGNPGGPLRSQQLREQYRPRQQRVFTHFVGDANAIHFTAVSHVRTREDAQESDVVEIGYFLKDCSGRLNKSQKSRCLWRRESLVTDDDVTKGGTESVLLENVDRFELRYLGPESQEEWLGAWKSDPRHGADDRTKGKFPYAAEITLSVKDKSGDKEKELTITGVAQLRFPNNPPPPQPGQPGQPADPLNPQNALGQPNDPLQPQNNGF